MAYEKQGKLARLPPSPAYKTVLALRALKASPHFAMDQYPAVTRPDIAQTAHRMTLSKASAIFQPFSAITVERPVAYATPDACTLPRPSFLPQKPTYKPDLEAVDFPPRPKPTRLKGVRSSTYLHQHQYSYVPFQENQAQLLGRAIAEESNAESDGSSNTSSVSLSMPPSVTNVDWEDHSASTNEYRRGPLQRKRCFFDDVLEDHVKAHERYIRKGGRIDPKSIYATLPTNVIDLAAHLGLATSHVRPEGSGSNPASSARKTIYSGGRARSDFTKFEAPDQNKPTVNRFANHGQKSGMSAAAVSLRAPFLTSRKSNESQQRCKGTIDGESESLRLAFASEALPIDGSGIGTTPAAARANVPAPLAATPGKKRRPRLADSYHRAACGPGVSLISASSPLASRSVSLLPLSATVPSPIVSASVQQKQWTTLLPNRSMNKVGNGNGKKPFFPPPGLTKRSSLHDPCPAGLPQDSGNPSVTIQEDFEGPRLQAKRDAPLLKCIEEFLQRQMRQVVMSSSQSPVDLAL